MGRRQGARRVHPAPFLYSRCSVFSCQNKNGAGRSRPATQPPAHFHRNPPGRGQLAVFPRCSLLTYRSRYARRSRLEKQPTDLRRKTCLFRGQDTRILERQKMLRKSQVLSRRLCVSCAAVLPFKDSEGGTWPLQQSDFKTTYICRHAPVKRHSQYADRSLGFASQQQSGPAISEAAEPRCITVSAIKPPDTSRWSEARPR